MKACLSKKVVPQRITTDNNQHLNIEYSKKEFFYEGQECRQEDDETNASEEINKKEKKRNHFRGNFNIFF